jgi:pyrimidine operon attenuation protein/uracil phosphoribosyltransferase
MRLIEKATVMERDEIERVITRLSHEIAEKNKDMKDVVIVGIRTRGVPLSERIAKNLSRIGGDEIPIGVLDITLYRDDLTMISPQPVVKETQIPFDIAGKKVILVDDVLYTGRTIRCALEALLDFGRPERIQLVILVDRGHRELPISADFVGRELPTSDTEIIEVRLKEVDGEDRVIICEREDG